MNKELITTRFSKARTSYDKQATVQHEIAIRTTSLISSHLPQLITTHPSVLEFGCGTGTYSRMIHTLLRPRKMLMNDLCPVMVQSLEDMLTNSTYTFQAGDAETEEFGEGWNLITSCSALQWFLDPEAFFKRCDTMLASKGYLAFSTFGPDNLQEVTSVTGIGLTYHTINELKKMLSSHFRVIHADEEQITRSFQSPLQVLNHLKQTGVTALQHKGWTRGDLSRFCHQYEELHTINSFVTLTYHPIYILAIKK